MTPADEERNRKDMMQIAQNWLTNMVLDRCHWSLVHNGDKIVGVAIDAGDAAATPMSASTTLRGLEGWGFEGIHELTQDISDCESPRHFRLDPKLCEYRFTDSAESITERSFKVGFTPQPTYFVFRGDNNIGLALNLLNRANEVSGEQQLFAARGR